MLKPESEIDMIVHETETHYKIDLFLQHICLSEISKEITKILKSDDRFVNLPIDSIKIEAGLPRLDYGQTVYIVLKKGDFSCMTKFPAYDTYKDEVLLHQ